eukprot:g4724.t1
MVDQPGEIRADLEGIVQKVQDLEARGESPDIAIRYLENVLKGDLKYRKIKKGNRKFSSEVWLQPGVRATFLAIGFREKREEDGAMVVLLEPFTEAHRRCTEVALQGLKDMRARRKEGGRAAAAAAAAAAGETSGGPPGSYRGAGGAGSRPLQALRQRGRDYGELSCEACGKSPLREDTRSNRPDVLYRAWRPNHAITCRVCPGFFVCGDCFNRQSYQHTPEHQLVLYAREERLAEQSPWPRRPRGNMPPPPGPGSGGRPRRGPWG